MDTVLRAQICESPSCKLKNASPPHNLNHLLYKIRFFILRFFLAGGPRFRPVSGEAWGSSDFPLTRDHPICRLPAFVVAFFPNKNGSPGSSCRSSDEGAPSERHGENQLLHVHVFRQTVQLACRVPRLDYQDVGPFGGGNRLIKGRT
ncbi:MAG: hypothetical protein JWM83_1519 [Candidatus Angelobacter sp.]|nr:hypothetical protein [Candidatus Angelobacter sp.]